MSARCPYNGGDHRLQVEPDQPCPVCGDYGDARAWNSDNCVERAEPLTSHAAAAAEIARLRGHVAALREAQAWKPIETAPKDGTPLLLTGWWNEDQDSGIRWRAVGAWHVEAGEWIEDCEEPGDTSLIPPTHWMLAPATPHEDETP